MGQWPPVKWFYPKGGDDVREWRKQFFLLYRPKVFHWARMETRKIFFCLYLIQPTHSLLLFSPPTSSEAVWPMAIGANSDDCYSTGSVPGKQGQPDLNNLWQLPWMKFRSKTWIKNSEGLGSLKCGFSHLNCDFWPYFFNLLWNKLHLTVCLPWNSLFIP